MEQMVKQEEKEYVVSATWKETQTRVRDVSGTVTISATSEEEALEKAKAADPDTLEWNDVSEDFWEETNRDDSQISNVVFNDAELAEK